MDEEGLEARTLLADGVRALGDLLGPGWQVMSRPQDSQGTDGADVLLEIRPSDNGVVAQLLVDARLTVTPRQVESVLLSKQALVQQIASGVHMLLLAPWISPRTQQILRAHGIGYLDLSGNAFLRVQRPAIIIHTEGTAKSPRPSGMRKGGKPTLTGTLAGRLVRVLVDHAPPYRAAQVAEAAGLSLAWVSRLLGLLEDQLLVRRDGRVITHVDWANLLRARADSYDLLGHNPYIGMLAPNGVGQVLDQLRSLPSSGEDGGPRLLMTGHYAARAVAPLTSGGQLMLYVAPGLRTPDVVGDQLGLLRVERNADVLLLRPHDEVVFTCPRKVDGINHVALSQLALDCLSGPGRLPAEGEAILGYMAGDESSWRETVLPVR